MELITALRSTASIRQFTREPVTDEVLYRVLDDARFAPSGGNRQAWHVIVMRDPAKCRALRDHYLDAWHDYVAHLLAGVIPFSPLASPGDRTAALEQRAAAEALSQPTGFAESFDTVPVMLVICANLEVLAATDRDLDRYQLVGGASIYPFVWNILLAAHEYGLGGVMTTIATRNEERVRQTLSIPANFAVASIVALGHPQKRPTKLTRKSVEAFATVDSFDGNVFTWST